MTNSSSAAPAAEELLRERDRVVQRLRSMALDAVPAERVLAAAQQLADLVPHGDQSKGRTVPALAPYAAGDQVTVLTGEVLALAAEPDANGGPQLIAEATAILTALRRDLAPTPRETRAPRLP